MSLINILPGNCPIPGRMNKTFFNVLTCIKHTGSSSQQSSFTNWISNYHPVNNALFTQTTLVMSIGHIMEIAFFLN